MLPLALLLLSLIQAPAGDLAADWEKFRNEVGQASNDFNEKLERANPAAATGLTRDWCAAERLRLARAREFLVRAKGAALESEIATWIRTDQTNVLIKEERLEYDALQRRLEDAKPEEVAGLRAEWRLRASRFFAEMLALAETIPLPTREREMDFATHLLTWILKCGEDLPEAQTAFERLPKRRVTDRELADLCAALANRNGAHVRRWLTAFSAEPFEPATRGSALYTLALQDLNAAMVARHLRANDEIAGRQRKLLDPVWIAEVEQQDPAQLEAHATTLLERVQAQFAECATYRGKLGELALAKLHELRDLAIGKQAPEISGSDVEGVAFKLSDYRGKVVVLDFWGYW